MQRSSAHMQYIAAGADWIFPEALANREEFQAFASAISVPLVANMTEFGKSPLMDFDDLSAMGYRVVLYPVTLLRVAMKAIESSLTILAAEGTSANCWISCKRGRNFTTCWSTMRTKSATGNIFRDVDSFETGKRVASDAAE